MMSMMLRCPVCKGKVELMSPKHIKESKCVCEKFDVHSDEAKTILLGIIHSYEGNLYLNRFPKGRTFADGNARALRGKNIADADLQAEVNAYFEDSEEIKQRRELVEDISFMITNEMAKNGNGLDASLIKKETTENIADLILKKFDK